MMATVPHVTSNLGLRKFQADGFLLTQVYIRRQWQPGQSLNTPLSKYAMFKVYNKISKKVSNISYSTVIFFPSTAADKLFLK